MNEAQTEELLTLLRAISAQLGAMAENDRFDVATLLIAALSALSTTSLAGLAVYIAAKAHKLQSDNAEAKKAADRRAVRETFLHQVEQHILLIQKAWMVAPKKRPRVLSFSTMLTLRSAALAMDAPDRYGALIVTAALAQIETKSIDWKLSRVDEFATQIGRIISNAISWSRDPASWIDSEKGAAFAEQFRPDRKPFDDGSAKARFNFLPFRYRQARR